MRFPHAARTLSDQLGQRYKSHSMEPADDPDGFGVHRKFKFDKTSSKLLDKVLPHLGDPRIVDHYMRSGSMFIVFSPRTIADQRDEFPLDAAEVVASAAPKIATPSPEPKGNPGSDGDGDDS